MVNRLLLATSNVGKITEFRTLLEGISFDVVSLKEVGIKTSVEETGKTFEENAILKAEAYARLSGLLTLADDSGLEVDALGGEPGIMSARYAGENATDEERVAYLLSKLKDVPSARRTARFRCVIAIARPGGKTETVEGNCEGSIAQGPRGKNGFGYDPVFYFPSLGKTLAELPSEIKNSYSHRGAAARKARKLLENMNDDR